MGGGQSQFDICHTLIVFFLKASLIDKEMKIFL